MKRYFFALLIFLFGYICFDHFYRPLDFQDPQTLIVYKKDTRAQVVHRLAEQKLISQDWLFLMAWRLYAPRAPLKSGAFSFHPPIRRLDILTSLVQGKMKPHFVMIPEGLTSWQVVQRLNEDPYLVGSVDIPKEGSLFPDTYAVPYGESRSRVIELMQENMSRVLESLWEQYQGKAPVATPYEALIMASMVEKETSKPDEYRRIAGIFYHRLKKDMRLQACPTVIYGLSEGMGFLPGPLKIDHLKHASPYNTYIIKGFPPGPICNPGLRALKAALNPLDTRELYFVADGQGGHYFGHTFEHHQHNRKKGRQSEGALKTPDQTPTALDTEP